MGRLGRDHARGKLRKRLTELGWKPSDLADAIRVADSVISRLLSGERRPSGTVAFKIERAVGLDAETWFEGDI